MGDLRCAGAPDWNAGMRVDTPRVTVRVDLGVGRALGPGKFVCWRLMPAPVQFPKQAVSSACRAAGHGFSSFSSRWPQVRISECGTFCSILSAGIQRTTLNYTCFGERQPEYVALREHTQ